MADDAADGVFLPPAATIATRSIAHASDSHGLLPLRRAGIFRGSNHKLIFSKVRIVGSQCDESDSIHASFRSVMQVVLPPARPRASSFPIRWVLMRQSTPGACSAQIEGNSNIGHTIPWFASEMSPDRLCRLVTGSLLSSCKGPRCLIGNSPITLLHAFSSAQTAEVQAKPTKGQRPTECTQHRCFNVPACWRARSSGPRRAETLPD